MLNEINEPKSPDTYPRVISKEQVGELLKAAKARKSTWTGQRDYTLLLLFIESGLRLNEMISAQVSNLNLEEHLLCVIGKGAKERSVSFGAKVYKALRKWLITREELDEIYDDNIFLDRNGEKLKKRNVQRIITTIQDKADLGDEDILPHVLRHTSATLSAKNGMNVSQLKQMYGWEQLETAKKYIHLSGRDVKEAIQEASPIDRL